MWKLLDQDRPWRHSGRHFIGHKLWGISYGASFTARSRSHSCGKILVEILLKVVENLRSWFQAVFFPQDVSRCLEFVMQISSKFNSRSISREYTFQAIQLWLCNVCPWHQGDEPSGLWKWGWSDQMRSKVNNSLTLWITDFVIVHPEGMNHPLSGYDNLHAWSNWL